MNITKPSRKTRTVGDLKPGDVFTYYEATYMVIAMNHPKLTCDPAMAAAAKFAVDLSSGDVFHFQSATIFDAPYTLYPAATLSYGQPG